MKSEKTKWRFLLIMIVSAISLHAQQVISTTGSDATGSGGTINYTVGQINYTTITGEDGSVTQGVQQPFKISIVTGIKEADGIVVECLVSPNPTTDYVCLKTKNYNIEKLSYQLYDNSGKLLETKKIDNPEINISMNYLIRATYILKITESNKVVKIFKIIKK